MFKLASYMEGHFWPDGELKAKGVASLTESHVESLAHNFQLKSFPLNFFPKNKTALLDSISIL